MKKIFCILLVIVMTLGLSSCGIIEPVKEAIEASSQLTTSLQKRTSAYTRLVNHIIKNGKKNDSGGYYVSKLYDDIYISLNVDKKEELSFFISYELKESKSTAMLFLDPDSNKPNFFFDWEFDSVAYSAVGNIYIDSFDHVEPKVYDFTSKSTDLFNYDSKKKSLVKEASVLIISIMLDNVEYYLDDNTNITLYDLGFKVF